MPDIGRSNDVRHISFILSRGRNKFLDEEINMACLAQLARATIFGELYVS